MIDAFALARNGDSVTGVVALSDLPRLDVLERQGQLNWRLFGFTGERQRLFMTLEVSGSLTLRCERCLQPMAWPLQLHATLWLAATEAEADSLPLDEDRFDVMVGSPTLQIEPMLEEEILLALPVTPKHAQCPEPLVAALETLGSPFAKLSALRAAADPDAQD